MKHVVLTLTGWQPRDPVSAQFFSCSLDQDFQLSGDLVVPFRTRLSHKPLPSLCQELNYPGSDEHIHPLVNGTQTSLSSLLLSFLFPKGWGWRMEVRNWGRMQAKEREFAESSPRSWPLIKDSLTSNHGLDPSSYLCPELYHQPV